MRRAIIFPAILVALDLVACSTATPSRVSSHPGPTPTLLPANKTVSQYEINQDGVVVIITTRPPAENDALDLSLAEGGSYTVLPIGPYPLNGTTLVQDYTAIFSDDRSGQIGYISGAEYPGSAAVAEAANLCRALPLMGASVSDAP